MARAPKEKYSQAVQVRSLPPTPLGPNGELRTRDVHDANQDGLSVRVGPPRPKTKEDDKERPTFRTFVITGRFPGSLHATRIKIGNADRMELSAARTKAKKWLAMMAEGIDPRAIEREKRDENRDRKERTFQAAADALFRNPDFALRRKAEVVRRVLEKDVLPTFGSRAVAEITPIDVQSLIEGVKARRKNSTGAYARTVFDAVAAVFKHVRGLPSFKLKESPCAAIDRKSLLGSKVARKRTLNDAELGAFWRGASTLGYPYAQLLAILALVGARLREVGDARWEEFTPELRQRLATYGPVHWPSVSLEERTWTIPHDRWKGGAGTDERELRIPLSPEACAILSTVPRFEGPNVFTTTGGQHPVDGYSRAKERLDKAIGEGIRDPWKLHDLRRSIRSWMADERHGISPLVAEAVLGHKLPGILGVYNRRSYLQEHDAALQRWAKHVREAGRNG